MVQLSSSSQTIVNRDHFASQGNRYHCCFPSVYFITGAKLRPSSPVWIRFLGIVTSHRYNCCINARSSTFSRMDLFRKRGRENSRGSLHPIEKQNYKYQVPRTRNKSKFTITRTIDAPCSRELRIGKRRMMKRVWGIGSKRN